MFSDVQKWLQRRSLTTNCLNDIVLVLKSEQHIWAADGIILWHAELTPERWGTVITPQTWLSVWTGISNIFCVRQNLSQDTGAPSILAAFADTLSLSARNMLIISSPPIAAYMRQWTGSAFGADNGLAPDRRQAIIWTNARILLPGPLGTNFNEISGEMSY